jgi:heme/copper-type cytochrome/quinol oxidase subunit 1
MAVDVLTPGAEQRLDRLDRVWRPQPGVLGWLTTVDHKRIGLLYFFTTLAFFGAGGIEALLMRAQLSRPEEGFIGPETYDQLMTMHGVTMIFFFIIPMTTGAFGNYLVPLMIGARDMAFPRLNALSYWLFLGSGLFIYVGVFIHRAPNCGWFCYTPLNRRAFDPGPNVDFYALGLIFNSLATTAGAINLIVTSFKLRAPGMSFNRMPLFVFAMLAVSFSLIFALPPLTTDLVFVELQRKLGFHFFDVAHGGDSLL